MDNNVVIYLVNCTVTGNGYVFIRFVGPCLSAVRVVPSVCV